MAFQEGRAAGHPARPPPDALLPEPAPPRLAAGQARRMLTTMSFSVGAPARLQVEARRRFKGTMLNTKRRPIKVRAPRRRPERPDSPQGGCARGGAAAACAFLAAALRARLASPALRRGGAVPWARALPRCGAGLRQRGAPACQT